MTNTSTSHYHAGRHGRLSMRSFDSVLSPVLGRRAAAQNLPDAFDNALFFEGRASLYSAALESSALDDFTNGGARRAARS
jgi:hypothetical protein